MKADNETLKREVKDTFQGKSIVGTKLAKVILECSSSKLDKLCADGLIPYSKPKTCNSQGEPVEGRMRFFFVSDLYRFMASNLKEAV